MKSNLPMPVVAAIIAVVVLGVGFFLWKKSGDAAGAGDIKTLANEVKSKEAADFTPQAAQGDAAMRGGAKKGR